MPDTPPLPDTAPAILPRNGAWSVLTPDGEIVSMTAADIRRELPNWPAPMVIHAPAMARRLDLPPLPRPGPWLDLLELFAFTMPARGVPPTARGLGLALDMPRDRLDAPEADLLPDLAFTLLHRIAQGRNTPGADVRTALAWRMREAGWPWGAAVCAALGVGPNDRPPASGIQPNEALKVWTRLPKWEETAPLPAPATHPVTGEEARARLRAILGEGAEQRPAQEAFTHVAASAFVPRTTQGDPHMVLAEAGTGTGKTLGYVAPASIWARRNGGTVWISTYTRHLQRQIESELGRLYPDLAERGTHVVVRKGRENYLCLLNMEESVNIALSRGQAGSGALIGLALIALWAAHTRDGDLFGGDLPGWFADLFGRGLLVGIADRRGECIHGACPHYQTCMVEHSIRRARTAELVIANHALVMSQAAWHALDGSDTSNEDNTPTRYIMDEGHHIADAADSAFALELSGLEAAELRRWLLGAEGARSRARGLRRRLEDLLAHIPRMETPLDTVLMAARALPAPGWSARLAARDPVHRAAAPPDVAPAATGEPTLSNPAEMLLHELRQQVLARTQGSPEGGSRRSDSECDLYPMPDDLRAAAQAMERALRRLAEPLRTLVARLEEALETEADWLDTPMRERIAAAIRSIRRRALSRVDGWCAMLGSLQAEKPQVEGETPQYIDYIRMDRREGQNPGERDVGLYRHWLDPTIPFASVLAAPAHGVLVTSATLRDETGDGTHPDSAERAWDAAEARAGAIHLPSPAIRASFPSPFDYARQSRAFIITDVAHDDPAALAGAYRTLFMASGGGALGLFTAISRLREVYRRIVTPLEAAGLPLYAQHVDPMDNATLVDILRSERNASLLGTDAMRDGVDVPGEALRLVAFERVPWPRPDILHRERRIHLSGGEPGRYDDRIARLRLRQAFGRLIRSRQDRGVFVLLDRRTPSRLLSAFPAGVTVRRLGLGAAAGEIRAFLHTHDTTADQPG
ncbi:ATP-dependent DNA helicase [Komagataeibacter sp. FNDCF1]|uniref:ATP-dependent DNA helicase n=1 Tax=Komagataeibacter sp. FNDCF1 TaxID=2878681 RepID=UPI001E390E85|nr:ATP-dependent DNA helicase [Komagataeibacter sp. FNDCF1]MCE2566008.1 ATP-dependent DNA helicase [Komagataeibacter sp. FNDCF1]